MFSDKKLMTKLIVSSIVYAAVAFIFTKLSFFQEIKTDGTKKIDWTKVLLVSIIPAGLVFYLSESYLDDNGKFHFSGIDETSGNFVSESEMQNSSQEKLD